MSKILRELTINAKFSGATFGYATMGSVIHPKEEELHYDSSFTMSGVIELKPFKRFCDKITLALSQDEIEEIEEICRKSMLRQINETINAND